MGKVSKWCKMSSIHCMLHSKDISEHAPLNHSGRSFRDDRRLGSSVGMVPRLHDHKPLHHKTKFNLFLYYY